MLAELAKPYNIKITKEQEEKFLQFYELLVFWNKKINLTTITEKNDIYIKHFLDSIYLSKYVSGKGIDIGTGAGFPGVPLSIMNEELDITLLDSLHKRCKFLEEVRKELNLNFEIIWGRAEEEARKKEYRERFDFAVSRAVAPLGMLAEYCIPYVKLGGTFYAMKGMKAQEEVEDAKEIVTKLGGGIPIITKYQLPDKNVHNIIEIGKINETPDMYPRSLKRIKKSAN